MAEGSSNMENLDNECSDGEEKVLLFGPPTQVQPTPESQPLEKVVKNLDDALPVLRLDRLIPIPLYRLMSHPNKFKEKPQSGQEFEEGNAAIPTASTNEQESEQAGLKSQPPTGVEGVQHQGQGSRSNDTSNTNSASTNKKD